MTLITISFNSLQTCKLHEHENLKSLYILLAGKYCNFAAFHIMQLNIKNRKTKNTYIRFAIDKVELSQLKEFFYSWYVTWKQYCY